MNKLMFYLTVISFAFVMVNCAIFPYPQYGPYQNSQSYYQNPGWNPNMDNQGNSYSNYYNQQPQTSSSYSWSSSSYNPYSYSGYSSSGSQTPPNSNQYSNYNNDPYSNSYPYTNPNNNPNNDPSSNSNNPSNQNQVPNLQQRQQFENFKTSNGKYYDSATDNYRFLIFAENMRKINQHNRDPSRSYDQGLNQFSDLTQTQFVATYLTAKPYQAVSTPTLYDVQDTPTLFADPTVGAITPIDWSSKAPPIKNQGSCGSCWIFSAVGAVQINVAIKKKAAPGNYAEQQVLDCSSSRRIGAGCNGGWPDKVFAYIGQYGIANTNIYPYTGRAATCKDTRITTAKYLKTTLLARGSSTSTALSWLASGSISIAIDATTWQNYKSGVLKCTQSTLDINHAVILVGVQADGIWKIRNSWGTGWGLLGYILVSSTKDCGVNQYLMRPNLL